MRRRYQFSLRTLFWLTAIVAALLAAGPPLLRPAGYWERRSLPARPIPPMNILPNPPATDEPERPAKRARFILIRQSSPGTR